MSRQFQTVETKRGKVWIPTNEGEEITGILTYKEGRTIGEGENEIGTIEILDLESGVLHLVPKHHVVNGAVEAIKEKYHSQCICRIVYKGQQENKAGKKYHSYQVQAMEAEQSELDALADFEANQW